MVLAFTEADLRRAAGEQSFNRGLGYVGAVADLEVSTDEVSAMVLGTDNYAVVLAQDGGDLVGGCSCPYGRDGFFCKHLVAAGLAVLRSDGGFAGLRTVAEAKAGVLDSWLAGLSREDLLALVRELASEDRDLRRRLELRAAVADPGPGTVQDQVRELLDPGGVSRHGYIEYCDAATYSRQVDEVTAVVGAMIDDGHSAEAAAIAGQALSAVLAALEVADDSDGFISGSAQELAYVHADACAVTPLDPAGLAGWLAWFALGPGQLLPDFTAMAYADALGDAGMAEYRRLITEAWRQDPCKWPVRHELEEVLRAAGDVDAVVALYAADLLPHGFTHLLIARELDRAGRAADALGWAERGLRDATGEAHWDLVRYLVTRYEEAGETGRALEVWRSVFRARRSLDHYCALRDAARKAGQWGTVREEAMAQLQRDADATAPARFGWAEGPVWVSALIEEGEVEAAWDAADGIASERQWLTLAGLISPDRPADALPVYLRAIESRRAQTGNDVYEQVADFLVRARECHERLGTTRQFTTYLGWLRADQKRKRNLMRLLDQRGL